MKPSASDRPAWTKGSRYFPLALDGILAIESRLPLFLTAATVGRWLGSDGTWRAPSRDRRVVASVLDVERQRYACDLLDLAHGETWRKAARSWERTSMAHRCETGAVTTLFVAPLGSSESCPRCARWSETDRPAGQKPTRRRAETDHEKARFRRSEPRPEGSSRGGSRGTGPGPGSSDVQQVTSHTAPRAIDADPPTDDPPTDDRRYLVPTSDGPIWRPFEEMWPEPAGGYVDADEIGSPPDEEVRELGYEPARNGRQRR